jgi:hypothetical protein
MRGVNGFHDPIFLPSNISAVKKVTPLLGIAWILLGSYTWIGINLITGNR